MKFWNKALSNPVFLRLYAAQTISQIGDALTWVGLALFAYKMAGDNASVVLSTALTLRVVSFVVLSPLAGVLADRINRKMILVTCDFGRMLVIALIPLATQVWQLYVLMLLINCQTAFFNPANRATIPMVVGKQDLPQALSLSSGTGEFVNIVGPALAGTLAAIIGAQRLFWFDSITFLLSGALILTLPALRVTGGESVAANAKSVASVLKDIPLGTKRLWKDALLRHALLMEFVAAIVGALILVNTVTKVEKALNLSETAYGWVMTSYGAGAVLAAVLVGVLGKRVSRTSWITAGAFTTASAILLADHVPYLGLVALWFIAGLGQNWVNLPYQTLIAARTQESEQGRVYGAHFAWSHLWWAFGYPIAGFLGRTQVNTEFLWGGSIAIIMSLLFLIFSLKSLKSEIE